VDQVADQADGALTALDRASADDAATLSAGSASDAPSLFDAMIDKGRLSRSRRRPFQDDQRLQRCSRSVDARSTLASTACIASRTFGSRSFASAARQQRGSVGAAALGELVGGGEPHLDAR